MAITTNLTEHFFSFKKQKHCVFALILGLFTGCSPFTRHDLFDKTTTLGEGKEWRHYPVVTDYNQDGKLDIIATHRRPLHENSLHIFLGQSDGSFRELEKTWGSPGYSALAVADFNSDGQNDIIAGSHFGKIHTFTGEAFGKFKENVIKTIDGYVHARFIDLNQDGKLEAVLLGEQSAGVEIYSPDSTGNWVLKDNLLPGNIGRDIKFVDMNADKRLDIVVSLARRGVVILLQNKVGGFDEAPATNFFSATNEFRSIDVSDVDKDGYLDIVLNGGFAGVLKPNGPDVYLGNGEGGWLESSNGLKVLKNSSEAVTTGDFNGDGNIDILAGGNLNGSIDEKGYGLFLFTGDGKGHWQLDKNSGLQSEGLARPYGIVSIDINHDGFQDLVVTHGAPDEGSGAITIWHGKKPTR